MTELNAGKVRHRVAIEAVVRTPDLGGGAAETWVTVAEAWAEIVPASGNEALAADQIAGRVSHVLHLRSGIGIEPEMRIRMGARVFEIRAVIDLAERRRWLRILAEAFAPGIALMHFDTAVNHGVGAAIRMLQEAAGATIDGEVGPETRAAITRSTPTGLVTRYADIRRAKYRALPHFWRFGRGWLRRADVTLERALALGDQNSRVDQQKGTETMQTDIPGAAPKWWGQSMTIWGALITALATVAPAVGPVIGVDITGEVIRQAGGQAAQAFQAVAGLVGTVLTIWGRFRAVQPLAQRDVSFKF